MALDPQDLEGRIEDIIHFDEYKPKMGKDDAVIVATFKVLGKQPAYDLENFIEKGYDWVIDAETSPGEISEGRYIVFVEAERRTGFPKKFMDMISDIKNISDVEDWKMVHYERPEKNPVQELSMDSLSRIPLSPKKYRDGKIAAAAMESILNTARVPRAKNDLQEFRTYQQKER